MSTLQSALSYAESGYLVFPVKPGSKRPLTKNGFKDASDDHAQIERWWQQWPGANIGLCTAGLLVFDQDPGGTDWLQNNMSTLETAPRQRTPRGGYHFVFRQNGTSYRSDSGRVANGIDVRADGGYVVVAPSTTADGSYSWDDGFELPHRDELPTIPEELSRQLNQARERETPIPNQHGKIGASGRHDYLRDFIRKIRNHHIPRELVREMALKLDAEHCDPPLQTENGRRFDKELDRMLDWAFSEGPSELPRGVHPAVDRLVDKLTEGEPTAEADSWPEPIAPDAFIGPAGDFVRTILPHTESDEAALLVQYLVSAGSIFGRRPHYVVEATPHHCNMDAVLVGDSSNARKGTSQRQVDRVLKVLGELEYAGSESTQEWLRHCRHQGIQSGEVLVWLVRDAIQKFDPKQGCDVIVDPGVSDKRAMVTEGEFAQILQVSRRESSTLSATIRQAWDSGDLRSTSKKDPARATDAHMSIVGHITRFELLKLLTDNDGLNGFANRFLWVAVRRSKKMAIPTNPPREELVLLARQLGAAAEFAAMQGEYFMTDAAVELWCSKYESLEHDRFGLFGAITARAAPQVIRLALIYAVLGRSDVIDAEHLKAGFAVWEYCERSAAFIFGTATGDKLADRICRFIQEGGKPGRSRTEISEYLGKNEPKSKIDAALDLLHRAGKAAPSDEQPAGRGRPASRWFSL